jgi:hypothetical protein
MRDYSIKGQVVTLAAGERPAGQKVARFADLCLEIARIKDMDFAGEFNQLRVDQASSLYFVPYQTIVGNDPAAQLGIRKAGDFFGGIVPYPYMKSKSVSHDVVLGAAGRPDGWCPEFAADVAHVVLPGISVFHRNDAAKAASLMFRRGRHLRGKRTPVSGGAGQSRLSSIREAVDAIGNIDEAELRQSGYVLELNLLEEVTRSVGRVEIGDVTVSYHGIQHSARDVDGKIHYGGSDLYVVRGGFQELLRHVSVPHIELAIRQAQVFDKSARERLGVLASRRNYDVLQGYDGSGTFMSGVLEASWKLGGASGAEIMAIGVMKDNSRLDAVRASSHFVYGQDVATPPRAREHYRGPNPKSASPLVVYSMVDGFDLSENAEKNIRAAGVYL